MGNLTGDGHAASVAEPLIGYAVGAQQQIAVFFASNGTTVIDPDSACPFFEVPINPPLPETLNYLQ